MGVNGLTWTTETRRLGDLIPWPRNPRQIRKDQAERLSDSLDQFGQVETIAIGPEAEVYNGHQRLNVWGEEHGPDLEIEVRVSSRPLTEKEREKLVVYLHRGAAGEWDFDVLANEFELDELLEWGFKPFELGLEGEDVDYEELWQGMPEFENEAEAVRTLHVHFQAPEFCTEFCSLLNLSITEQTKTVWYPMPPERVKHTFSSDES